MNSIKTAILSELSRCPKAKITDIIKLVYQHCFGGEHMIKDEKASLIAIKKELATTKYSPNEPLYSDIGGNYLRLNLKHFHGSESEASAINRIFTVGNFKENKDENHFIDCLNLAVKLAEGGLLPFAPLEAATAIGAYLKGGVRAISHSKAYKENYRPAYRIVGREFAKLIPLVEKIEEMLLKGENIIIAIDGMCGSGKSTIANTLKTLYSGVIIALDDFFLPQQLRTPQRLKEPGGNIDYDRYLAQVLAPLKARKAFSYSIFDCSIMDFNGEVNVGKNPVIICEGSYSLSPKFASAYSLKVFVECSQESQLKRIKARNAEDMVARFIGEWIPMENKYFAAFSIKNSCDIIVKTD